MNKLNRLFLDLIPLFHRVFSSRFYHKKEPDESKLTRSQEKALMITSKHGKLLPSFLSRCMDMRPGSLTPLMDELVNLGLMERIADSDDRRKQWLVLTVRGAEWVRDKEKEMEQIIEDILKPLSDETKQRLQQDLSGVIHTLRTLQEET